MINKIGNDKGFTIVETLVVIVISFVTISSLATFNISLARHKVDIHEHMELNAAIDNKITDLYNSADWSSKVSTGEPIDSGGKETILITSYELVDEYNTEKLSLEFSRGAYSKKYEIERSTYYEYE